MTNQEPTGLSAEASRILEERARDLARPLGDEATAASTLALVTFARGESAYALPASDAIAVVPVCDPTPVPGTPPAVRGVVNHRGRILAAVDVGRVLSAEEQSASEPELGIVVASGPVWFVLLSDTVPELVAVEESDVTAATDGAEGPVRGVTGAMAAVLDISALASDPRIVVDDEVE